MKSRNTLNLKMICKTIGKSLITCLIACAIPQARADVSTLGQGLPLPWPFPWAKECPVNWKSMEGRYLLSDSNYGDQIDLKITIVEKVGYKLVRVSRYSAGGMLLSDGFTWVSEDEKMVRLWLYPKDTDESPTWAIIKLYYGTAALRCSADQLIPILTLEQPNIPDQDQKQFRLVRIRE